MKATLPAKRLEPFQERKTLSYIALGTSKVAHTNQALIQL
jgi:hypothetical protein